VFESLLAPWKIKLGAALKSAACALVAAVALVLALAFGAAALFVWVQMRHGTINACLAFAGAFLLLAVIAVVVMLVLRRAAAREAAAAAARAKVAPFLDPRVIAAGLSLGKSLGGRRALSLGLIGAFLVGFLMSRGADKK
jgi:hypothetical protein